jgi:nicotinamidase-related amidase
MKTLILIDFQNYYMTQVPEKERRKIIENTTRLARVFMTNDWPIIVVMYEDVFDDVNNDIVPEMKDILLYKNSVLVRKNRPDGSEQVLDQIDFHKWPLNVVVCGVFGDECLQETVNGLLERDRQIEIEVLKDCMWPDRIVIEEDNENRVSIRGQSELVVV